MYKHKALRLGLVTVLSSPDSACTESVEVPDLQSVGQVETTRRVVSTSSDYLLSIPENLPNLPLEKGDLGNLVICVY